MSKSLAKTVSNERRVEKWIAWRWQAAFWAIFVAFNSVFYSNIQSKAKTMFALRFYAVIYAGHKSRLSRSLINPCRSHSLLNISSIPPNALFCLTICKECLLYQHYQVIY